MSDDHRFEINDCAKDLTMEHSRREFLRSGGRLALLGVGAFAAAFFVNRRQVAAGGQSCVNEGFCPSCRTYRTCGLPPALSRRKALEKTEQL